MITLPEALLIVKLFPVVFMTGFGVAEGSIVIASKVPFTLSFFVGAFVPMVLVENLGTLVSMPTLPVVKSKPLICLFLLGGSQLPSLFLNLKILLFF